MGRWLVEEADKMERENPQGNTEYKLRLVKVTPNRLEEIATQLKYRVEEGLGEAIYEIGVTDEGEILGLQEADVKESLLTLEAASEKIGAKCTLIRAVEGKAGKALEVLIRRTKESGSFPVWLYLPVLGNVDSGKSTLVGVLSTGKLDDGNGYAMARVARYLHEIKMRRTSSVCSRPLGFDESGNIVNYTVSSPLDEAEVFLNSAKIIDFVDLGGHERYFKTTLRGITGHSPDYCLITVAANAGIMPMTVEHLKVVLGLRLPMIFVVTKIDLAPHLVSKTVEDIQRLVKLPKVNAVPFLVKTIEDAIVAAKVMPCGRVAPIFTVSNVTGEGLNLLRTFLNLLPQRIRWNEFYNKEFMIYVDEIFNVKGVGPVVSGVIRQGAVAEGESVLLGPFHDGTFRNVRVKSIHINRVFVERAVAGNDACFALAGVSFGEIRKGMALLGMDVKPRAVGEFEADVFILHHPTTIRIGYQAVVHAQTVRQAAEFVEIVGNKVLRTGDYGRVKLAFLYNPEFLIEGQNFVFREASAKGIGVITKIR
ncbi:MAG: GTP-binding protein [Candidatus Bathyarchaeia archaeon]